MRSDIRTRQPGRSQGIERLGQRQKQPLGLNAGKGSSASQQVEECRPFQPLKDEKRTALCRFEGENPLK